MNAIYLTDLALLYFPHSTPRSAVSQLRRWVNLNSELQQRLTELHYQKGQRALTPLQHAAFVEFLGDPGARYRSQTTIPGIGFRCRGFCCQSSM